MVSLVTAQTGGCFSVLCMENRGVGALALPLGAATHRIRVYQWTPSGRAEPSSSTDAFAPMALARGIRPQVRRGTRERSTRHDRCVVGRPPLRGVSSLSTGDATQAEADAEQDHAAEGEQSEVHAGEGQGAVR